MIVQLDREEGAAAGPLSFKHPLHTPRLLVVTVYFFFRAFTSFVARSSSSVCRSFSPFSFSLYPLTLLSGASVVAATPPLSQRAQKKDFSPHLTAVHATCTAQETPLQTGTTVHGAANTSCVTPCASTTTADGFSQSLPRTDQKPPLGTAFSRQQQPISSLGERGHSGAAGQYSLLMNTRLAGGTRRSPLPSMAFDAATPAAVHKARSCLLSRTPSAPCILSRPFVPPSEPVVLAAAVVTELFSPTTQDAPRCHAADTVAQNRTRLVVTLYATTAAGIPIRENRGGTSSSHLATRRRLLAAAVLLFPTLFPGGGLLLKEGYVKEAPARGLVARAFSTTSLFPQHAQSQKISVPGGRRQKETKLNQKCVSVYFFAGGSTNPFVSCKDTPLHDFTSSCSNHAGTTQTPLTAAVVNCSEPSIITLPRLTQKHSKFSNCVTYRCRTPMLFTWPSSCISSSSTSLCAARSTSSLYLHPRLCCWQKKCLLIQSRLHYFFPPLSATGNNSSGFTIGEGNGLLCSPQSCKRIASALGDTLLSYTRSNAGALSRILATGTNCRLVWLLHLLPRLLTMLRHFAACTNGVDLRRQNIHVLVSLPVKHKLANTLKRVATHFASLFESSRVCALMEGRTSAAWIAAAVEATAECAAAAATFYSTCAASLLLQKNMGVSCAAKTCKLFGVATVFAASNAAAGAASTMRYMIAALHSRPGTGNDAAKLQFPSMVIGKLDRCSAEIEPLPGAAVQNFHSSTSSLCQQQTDAARVQASAVVAAKETGWTAKTAALHQQMRGLVLDDISADTGVQQQQGSTPRGTVVGQAIQPGLHVAGQDMSLPSTCSITESLRTWGASSEALHACVKEGVLGCIVFWLLGGRFFRLSPSSLLAPGAYHQHHLSLRAGIDYASLEERRFIKKLGETFGCHTCGKRRVEEWVADHQPPKSVVVKFNQTWLGWLYGSLRRAFGGTRYLPQRFYPQCKTCSSKQASVVKYNGAKTRKTDLIVNWNSLRAYHLTGGVLQFLRVLAGW